MSFEQDFIADLRGKAAAAKTSESTKVFRDGRDAQGNLDTGYLGGFASSVASAIPEFVGADPTPAAQKFRDANPVSGVISELLPTFGAYGAVFKASQLPKAAAALESTVARTGLSAVESPIAYGAVKEIVRYSPLELGRLGIGFATQPSDNWGGLLADVGLSTLLNGAFGGIGGFFRGAGKVQDSFGHVVGSDLAFAPTFTLRMARTEGSQLTGGLDKAVVENDLVRAVLTENPYDAPLKGARGRFVDELDGAKDVAESAEINGLFKARSSSKGLTKRKLLEGLPEDNFTINAGEQTEIATTLGMKSIADVAENIRYPRVLDVNTDKAAAKLAKTFDDASGLQYVGDNTWLGKETNDGLFVFFKKIKAAQPIVDDAGVSIPPKQFGGGGIAAGDRFIAGKTDKPGIFAPSGHKVAEFNIAQQAKYRKAYQPLAGKDDIFNAETDKFLSVLYPGDYRDIGKLSKQTAIAQIADLAVDRVASLTGLKGSAQAREFAEGIYNVVKPTMFLESGASNPLFGRLFSVMRNNFRTADTEVQRYIQGSTGQFRAPSAILADLTPAEINLVALAKDTQTPAESLAKLSTDGLISPKASAAVAELQAINDDFLNRVVMPALRSAGMDEVLKPLEGYISPRIWKGEWSVPVLDDRGKEVWMAAAKTPGVAKAEADAIIAEAAAKGIKYTRPDAALNQVEYNLDVLQRISNTVSRQLKNNPESQEVIQSALSKVNAAHFGATRLGSPGTPKTFLERTGRAGSPDIATYTADDILGSMEAHMKTLGHFSAYHTFNDRWASEVLSLSKTDKRLYQDLLRKGNQLMGIEGAGTQWMNNALTPILGSSLGSKAATRIANGTNGLMYAWNIGIANPVFALSNLLTPLLTLAPHISFVLNAPLERVAQNMQFLPRYGADGRIVGQIGQINTSKVMASIFSVMKNPDEALLEAHARAKLDGTLQSHHMEEWVGGQSKANRSLKDAYRAEGGWGFIKDTATWMSRKSESFARNVSFHGGWIVGRDHFGLEGDQLYNFARKMTEVTNYNYAVVDRPRMFTGPIGSMFGLFKNWQLHFIGNMANYADLGLKEGVWAPMLWQFSVATALGGIGATPLRNAADGLARWASDSPSSFQWMQENWGKDTADELYFGLPALLGMSLQASNNIPGSDIRNEMVNLSNFVFLERAKAAGKAVGDAWTLGRDGDMNALRDPNIRDKLIQAFAPRAFTKAFSAAEGDYVKSMATGYPSVREIGPSARILEGLGFNAIDVASQQLASRQLYLQKEKYDTMVRNLGERFAQGQLAKDSEEMQRVLDMAVLNSVPVTSVLKSGQNVVRRELVGDNLSRYDKAKAAEYLKANQ